MIPLLFSLLMSPAQAMDVVCTLPWLGDIAHRMAPDAEITVLVRATEDPHFLSPTPALMAKVGAADLFVENGMGLELWSERLLDGAGNPSIRRGQPGHVLASQGVHALAVPGEVSRAQGDLHAQGNPHIGTDPLNAPIVADNIAAGLARIDPAHAAEYQARAKAFHEEIDRRAFGEDLVGFMGGDLLERLARGGKLHSFLESKGLSSRLGGWLGAAAPLNGQGVVFYHQSWIYLIDRFGMVETGYIEDRPGVAPSASHRDALKQVMQRDGVKRVAVGTLYDDRLAKVLADEVGARVIILPSDVGATDDAGDYFAFIDALVNRLK